MKWDLHNGRPSWFATFLLGEGDYYSSYEVARVNIEKVQYEDGVPMHYVSHGVVHVGWFPGYDSDEWIEYVPPFVEKPPRLMQTTIDGVKHVYATAPMLNSDEWIEVVW